MHATRRRAALFVNPGAASGLRRDGRATSVLAERFDLSVHETSGAPELCRRARAEALGGCEVVIAGGGDGTINHVINAIADTGAVLGILPLGTANDLARRLRLPVDPVAAAIRISRGAIQRIDLIEVNGHLLSTVGGTGLATDCAEAANRIKAARGPVRWLARVAGKAIYAGVAVPLILRGGTESRCDVALEWTDEEGYRRTTNGPVHGVFFTNQATIAGNLTLPVPVTNAGGTMGMCVMPAGGRFRLLRTVLALRLGRALPRRAMAVHRATSATLVARRPLGILGDGEILERGTRFDWRVRPAALPVIA